ncbi:MAG TPA: UbiA family prenyltransferase [Tepidisphaeraceae bacterium]|jgi:4-hydroxybenzoate polyprenyltransferase|nr:UbiA family prenyltransferase [Tepidisphaeraceae bacterium]
MAEISVELHHAEPSVGQPPLCIDMDGTLIATDSLWEATLLLIREKPAALLRVPGWILAGRATLKEQVARRVSIDVRLLPYRKDVVELMRSEKASGRTIVLATAAHRSVAEAVADHVGGFDEVIASGDGRNLKGPAKLAELERRFGAGNFDYVGDAVADRSIWKSARRAYVVEGRRGALAAARAVCAPQRVFPAAGGLKPMIRAMRPHQWVKNLLLFIPLLLPAEHVKNWAMFSDAVYAFWSFSACASAIYIINDLLDLESDRRHHAKCKRPFAAGEVSVPAGLMVAAGALIFAFALTLAIPWRFSVWLATYLAMTTAYSFWLKRKLLVDVILLAGLYTLRIIAGAAAVDVQLTMWLLAFSMFFFLSLAFAKRYSELIAVEDAGEAKITGRAYEVRDLRVIESVGPSSGYLAVLVFCNYLSDARVSQLYGHPQALWLVAPILLYWITRVWFIARRRSLHDDPIVFAIRDYRSYLCGILVAAVVVIASLHRR